MKILVVGAGFSGAVVAGEMARAGHQVHVIDERDHVGGNCYTCRDEDTGVMVHKYGPHIFNTSIKRVWEYVNKYGDWGLFTNRVKASTDTGIYSLPINLHTINQFFDKKLSPSQAEEFLKSKAIKLAHEPRNFEEQALNFIGAELYYEFFYGYTKKQWGVEPNELPASILKRLPVRFNYNDNYYNSRWQAIPIEGYTQVFDRILKHKNISLELGISYSRDMNKGYDKIIYTGPLDKYFDYKLGRLSYRTVFWEKETTQGDALGNAVINYCSEYVPFTRIHEHKHFAPWENHEKSIIFTEYSKETEPDDIPYYPKRLKPDLELLSSYQELTSDEHNVEFLGRLATYRYLNMDAVIDEALSLSERLLKCSSSDSSGSSFGF